MLFSFAGSSHSKYVTYILEMVTLLEIESSPESKDFWLSNWLVNPKGEPGHHIECDILQEHHNEVGEDGAGNSGRDFGDPYVSEVIGRTAGRSTEIKTNVRPNLGLKIRSVHHPEPHSRPEIRTLLRTYKEHQLHKFREGHCYSKELRDVDDFNRGIQTLRDGKLQKWIKDSSNAMAFTTTTTGTDSEEGATFEEAEEEEDDSENVMTVGRKCMIDGELVFLIEEQGHGMEDQGLGDEDAEGETDDDAGGETEDDADL